LTNEKKFRLIEIEFTLASPWTGVSVGVGRESRVAHIILVGIPPWFDSSVFLHLALSSHSILKFLITGFFFSFTIFVVFFVILNILQHLLKHYKAQKKIDQHLQNHHNICNSVGESLSSV